MLVISNHVRAIGMSYPEGALIRINLAWISGGAEEAMRVIEEVSATGHDIYLDYPSGRRKPPKPSLHIMDAIRLCEHPSVKIFAFSNAESPDVAGLIRATVPTNVDLCPKIESQVGVDNLDAIINATRCPAIMLDAEDLFADLDHDGDRLTVCKNIVRQKCAERSVTCLELKGVIFGHG